MDATKIFSTIRSQLFRDYGKDSRLLYRKIWSLPSFNGSKMVSIKEFFQIFLNMGIKISQKETDAWLFSNDPDVKGIMDYK